MGEAIVLKEEESSIVFAKRVGVVDVVARRILLHTKSKER
jgi:hypothetical protein